MIGVVPGGGYGPRFGTLVGGGLGPGFGEPAVVGDATFLYTPPIAIVDSPDKTRGLRQDQIRRRIGAQRQYGLTVIFDGSSYVAVLNPSLRQTRTAETVYLGGRVHRVSSAVKSAIEASGIGGTFETEPI